MNPSNNNQSKYYGDIKDIPKETFLCVNPN